MKRLLTLWQGLCASALAWAADVRRQVAVPAVVAGGAWSWASYLVGTDDAQDRARLTNWWGWLDPRLDEHWCRLFLSRPATVADQANVLIVTGGHAVPGPIAVSESGWLTLKAVWRAEGRYHRLKNVGAEWARLDPQRAYKAAAFVVVGAFLAGVPIGATVCWVLVRI